MNKEIIIQTLLGQIPEAIYFAWFMIFTKKINNKRILFTILMIVEYLLLKQVFRFNVWFQILYTFMTFVTLKVLYKEKSQVTDIFTFGIASFILMITSMICFILFSSNMYVVAIVNRIVIFGILFIFRTKLYNIQKLYKKLWNRNDKISKIMKSTTFRAINVVVFNLMFYIINFCLLIAIKYNFHS